MRAPPFWLPLETVEVHVGASWGTGDLETVTQEK